MALSNATNSVFPPLAEFKKLCGASFIDSLHAKRKKCGKIKRMRLLGTLEILWLLIGIAAFSHLPNLASIIQHVQCHSSLRTSISVTAFCKARDAFSPKHILLFWRHICSLIYTRVEEPSRTWRGFSLMAIDKCTLALPEKSILYKKFKSHRTGVSDSPGPVAVEICCFFDAILRIPLYLVYNKSNTSEHKMLPKLMKYVQKTHLILIDNGFYSWKHFDMIRKREAHFICPLTTSSRPKVIKKLNDNDYLCQIKQAQGKGTMALRVIYLYRNGFRRRRIATSLVDHQSYPREEIGDIYHKRWHIETYYREFKSSMKATNWHCGKPESFLIELYSKMILACLVRYGMVEAINSDGQCTISISDLSFSNTLRHFRHFLMDIVFNKEKSYKQLRNILLRLILKSLVNSKAGRSFSRDKQFIRKKARGLIKGKVGRPRKNKEVKIAEEDRPQMSLCGQGENTYYELLE